MATSADAARQIERNNLNELIAAAEHWNEGAGFESLMPSTGLPRPVRAGRPLVDGIEGSRLHGLKERTAHST